MPTELLLKDEVYAIIGAAIEVHNVLGGGFAEAVYQEAMEIELKAQHEMTPREESQIINDLQGTGLRVGLLINVGDPSRLDWKRFVY